MDNNQSGHASNTDQLPVHLSMKKTMSRRGFLKAVTQCAAGATIAGVGGLGYTTKLEPYWVDVEQMPLTLPRLHSSFNSYKVAQISDLHMGEWLSRAQLQDVVTSVNRENPDLIVITGDFVSDLSPQIIQDLREVLGSLQAKDAVVGVLGNHDYWNDAETVRGIMRDSKIRNISNDVYTLRRGNALFHICGVDDIWERHDKLDVVLGKLPADGAALLLAHEPDFADKSAATERFDMQVSGHSHGGQVVAPVLGPLRLPYLGEKYSSGLYKVGDMLQYTNRGIGMVYPYVRFNCRPEITVFTLSGPANT